jgi:GcrA cell cycle regulator
MSDVAQTQSSSLETRDAIMREWGNGLSASKIAVLLGLKSRNVVIGVVTRHIHKYPGVMAKRPARTQPVERHRPVARIKLAEIPALAAAAGPRTAARPLAAPRAVLAYSPPRQDEKPVTAPEKRLLQIEHLTEFTCRYPIGHVGDSGFGFCGQTTRDGSPYCEYHASLAHQPGYELRRANRRAYKLMGET